MTITKQSVTKGVVRKVRWPKADDDWRPLAKEIYNGCQRSRQAKFYQLSDIPPIVVLSDQEHCSAGPWPSAESRFGLSGDVG